MAPNATHKQDPRARPSAARFQQLAQLHAQKPTANLRWLAANTAPENWTRDLWLAAIEVQRQQGGAK